MIRDDYSFEALPETVGEKFSTLVIWKRQTLLPKKATEVEEHQLCFTDTNYDTDGDEMYHDILDILSMTQPREIYEAPVTRDSLRPLAKDLHDSRIALRQQAIRLSKFKSLVKLLLS